MDSLKFVGISGGARSWSKWMGWAAAGCSLLAVIAACSSNSNDPAGGDVVGVGGASPRNEFGASVDQMRAANGGGVEAALVAQGGLPIPGAQVNPHLKAIIEQQQRAEDPIQSPKAGVSTKVLDLPAGGSSTTPVPIVSSSASSYFDWRYPTTASYDGNESTPWMTGGNSAGGVKDYTPWVQYTFDQVYALDSMRVLNFTSPEFWHGVKDVEVLVSQNGTTFTSLGYRLFAPSSATAIWQSLPLGGLAAKSVKFVIHTNYYNTIFYSSPAIEGPFPNASIPGLSEVQFYATVGSNVPCAPNCAGKTCGSDGCGGYCGGQLCTGSGCVLNADCAGDLVCSGVAPGATAASICQPLNRPGSCTNGVLDVTESDVDCGGMCGPCAKGHTCKVDADCGSTRVCGQNNGAHFGLARSARVCWDPSCEVSVQAGGCGQEGSACGKNCFGVTSCLVGDPTKACALSEVCAVGLGAMFGSESTDVCVNVACPSNDPALCGGPHKLCGPECQSYSTVPIASSSASSFYDWRFTTAASYDSDPTTLWMTAGNSVNEGKDYTPWVQYNFDRPYALESMRATSFPYEYLRTAKDVEILVSQDGTTFTSAGYKVFPPGYSSVSLQSPWHSVAWQSIDFAGLAGVAGQPVKAIKLAIHTNRYGGLFYGTPPQPPQETWANASVVGFPEVRFYTSDSTCSTDCSGKTCGRNACGQTCGGSLCTGSGCVATSDCADGLVCSGYAAGGSVPSICQPPGYGSTCANGVRDWDETDVDCGGPCGKCGSGGGCTADADCASDLVCGNANSACFGKGRGKKVCWKPVCAQGTEAGGCGSANSPCGQNCACDDTCDSKNPNSVCPSGEVCKADLGRIFGSSSADVCADPRCPSNDPALCGSESSVCGKCVCTPNCAAATCGNPSDGCGGVCPGVCGAGMPGPTGGQCTNSIQCPVGLACLPVGDGSIKACLPRTCEGIVLKPPLCGSAGAVCGDQCPVCTPSCDGRQCGADPNCGQSCGTCAGGSYCAGDGQCVTPTVEPPPQVPDGNGGQKDLPPLTSSMETSKVGALNGRFSVSDQGTAQYTIPFEVPPGRAGIEPALSLSYASTKANGDEGVGWHLEGLSKITRCPRSFGIDGYAAPIKNNTSDLFCIDGKRLEARAGNTYGGDGAEYRTLIDSFAEIKSYWDAGDGIQLDLAPNLQRVPRGDRGPDRFVVRTNDGKTLTFGTTRDSLVLAPNGIRYAWLLKRVEDRAGNYMTVSYENYHANLVKFDQMMSNMVRPSAISYTGHGSTVGNRHVFFEYSQPGVRTDSLLNFGQGGVANVVPDRLAALKTYANGKAVKNYRFHYPDGLLSQIDSVQECAGSDTSICKPATTFEYKVDQGFTLSSQTGAPSSVESAGRLDTDGDGIPDYLITTAQQNAVEGSTALAVAKVSTDVSVAVGAYAVGGVGGVAINAVWNLAKGAFWGLFGHSPTFTIKHEIYFGAPQNAPLGYQGNVSGIKCNNVDTAGHPHPLFLQDFDLDGKDDVVTACGTNNSDLYVAKAVGDGTFQGFAQGALSGSPVLNSAVGGTGDFGFACQDGAECFSEPAPIMLDVDGDSLQDVITCADPYTLQVWRRRRPTLPVPTTPIAQSDFLPALVLNAPPATYYQGEDGLPHSSRASLPLCETSTPTFRPFDIDGDGAPDLLVRAAAGWFVLRYSPNANPGLSWESVTLPDIGGSSGSAGGALTLGDFNGDGLADLANTNDTNEYVMWMNTGGRVFNPLRFPNPKVAYNADHRYQRRRIATLDYNADGHTDLFENWHWTDGDVNVPYGYAFYDRNFSLSPNSRFDLLTPTEATDAVWLNSANHIDQMPWSFTGDFDGDGNTDLFAGQIAYGHGASNLLLSKVVDGLGNVTTVDYDDRAYHADGNCSGMQWPETCLQKVHGLVYKHAEAVLDTNGQAVTERTFVYKYVNARVNVTGEGWLGFDRRSVDTYSGIFTPDISQSLSTTTIEYQPVTRFKPDGTTPLESAEPPYVYPLAGLPRVVTIDRHIPADPLGAAPPLRDADYEQRTQITNDWEVHQSAANRPFAFLGARLTARYDRRAPGGFIGYTPLPFEEPGIFITSCLVENVPDGFGNVKRSIEGCELRDGPSVDTTITTRGYLPDAEGWPTPNLHTLQIESTVTMVSQNTSTQSYEFDYLNGLPHVVTRHATGDWSTNGPAQPAQQEHSTTYERDEFGNVRIATETAQNQESRVSIFTYDADNLFPKTITAAGQTTQLAFDGAWGAPTAVVDPNGIVTSSASYDGFGRQVQAGDPTGLSITTYSVATPRTTPVGQIYPRIAISTERQARNSGLRDGGKTVELDSRGRVVRSITEGFGGVPLAQETLYDQLGLIRAKSLLHPAAATTGPKDQYEYDGLQRVVRVTHADNTYRQYDYASIAGLRSEFASWLDGFTISASAVGSRPPIDVVRTTDEENHQNVVVTDYLGRVIRSIDGENLALGAASSSFASSNYWYGPFGQLVWATDNRGLVTGMYKDAYGRLIFQQDPDVGLTSYSYNGFDELATSTDPSNHTRTFYHDILGRLDHIDDGGGAITKWNYDVGANALGRVSETISPTGQHVHYSYEAPTAAANRGLLNGMTYTLDGRDYSIDVENDDLGRALRVHYPTLDNGTPIVAQYGYDPSSGRLNSVKEVGSGVVKPLWQIDHVTDGYLPDRESFGNGASTTYSVHPTRRWLEHVQTTLGTTPIQDLTYTHYNNGLVHERVIAGGVSHSYSYDALNRLVTDSATAPGGTPADATYTYDDIGNIKLRGANFSVYREDKPHQVDHINGNYYSYDGNGNVQVREGDDVPLGREGITYTPFNLPKAIGIGSQFAPAHVTQFEYSANEERVIRRDEDDGITRHFVSDLYERQLSTTDATLEEHFRIFAGNRAIGEIVRKAGHDQTLYFHTDHLGTVDTISDGDGNSFQQHFEAFGATPPGTPSPTLTRAGFTGHNSEADLGLIDMKGRFYDPLAARFASADPVLQAPFSSQGLNRYSYVFNNPVNNIDPSGFEMSVGQWVGGGLFTGADVGLMLYAAGVFKGVSAASVASGLGTAANVAGPVANVLTTIASGIPLDGSIPGGAVRTVPTPSAATRSVGVGAQSSHAAGQNSPLTSPVGDGVNRGLCASGNCLAGPGATGYEGGQIDIKPPSAPSPASSGPSLPPVPRMKLTPPWTPRLPDYFSLSLNFTIPTQYTGQWLGGSLQLSLDRTGELYFGFGPSVGKSPTIFSGDLMGGWLTQWAKPTAGELNDFMTGSGVSAGGGYFGGGFLSFSPSTRGTAINLGAAFPQQYGAGYTYTFDITSTGVSW